jgi:hypothetical protein
MRCAWQWHHHVNMLPRASQVQELGHPAAVFASCMELISRLAAKGLVHCDFNEFNLLIDDEVCFQLAVQLSLLIAAALICQKLRPWLARCMSACCCIGGSCTAYTSRKNCIASPISAWLLQERLTLIDFPQMVSVSHSNAKDLFDRDVQCIIRCDAVSHWYCVVRASAVLHGSTFHRSSTQPLL